MSHKQTVSPVAWLVIVGKLAPKLVALGIKFKTAILTAVKSSGSIKAAGIAGSVGMYTYLFTWQTGLALVIFLGIHEYGHIWAMHRCGIKTRGMFFIPGFGAVAVADEKFGSARNEAYIAIMGPVWGLAGFVVPALLAYVYTRHPLWLTIASLTAFIQILNLLPINPLDGGRIFKALAYSSNQARSLLLSTGMSVVTCFLGMLAHFEILWYMAVIGWFENAESFGINKHLQKLGKTMVRLTLGSILFFSVSYLLHSAYATWSWLWGPINMIATVILIAMILWDAHEDPLHYPVKILQEMRSGVREITNLRAADIKPIEGYPVMETWGKIGYSFGYVILVLLHVVILIILKMYPAGGIGAELLQ